MSDDNKLSLSGRGLAGAARGRETGKVRQNFSHGRSKAVVVEHRKKRLLKKGGAATDVPAATLAPTPSVGAEKPFFKPKAPAPSAPAGSLTNRELEERKRALASLEDERHRQEEDRRRVDEEARRRQEEERRRKAEDEALRDAADAVRAAEGQTVESSDDLAARRAEDHARKLAEQAAKRAAEDKIRKKAEAEARKKAEEEETAREEQRKKTDDKRPPEKRVVGREEEDDAGKRGRSRRGRGGDNRRSGKLSVNRAFEGEEGEERRRSLAAFRRAQAKRRGGRPIQEQAKQAREVVIPESITVQELANRMAEKAVDVIRMLMNMDIMATINDSVDPETAELIVTELGHTPKRVLESDVEIGLIGDEDSVELKKPRPPVVTIMGHVDHGKTSLLDALRATDVAGSEAGGITQHIGAYQVVLASGARITFLDTPGHEAFTQMRARGASVTDIVILVVAADDGVMPQTIEAISHARAAGVPIIVAINKMDAPGADPDRVRQELLQHDIQVEAMGGDVLDIEVSALKKTNLDKLEEAILLQAELLELAANPDRPADGVVVEARLEKGRGPVATVLVRRGTLRIGDLFVAGAETGRVRAMMDERGRQIEEAGPARPVEVLGLNGAPSAGDDFAVVESENRAREISAYRQSELRKQRQFSGPASVETMFTQLREKKAESFPVIIKGDVQGSVEAIAQTLGKIGGEDIKVRVLHAAAGAVTESDVTLAKASDCMIIAFNVRANKQAREAAERDGVMIKFYSVIYNLVDEMKAAMAGQLGPVIEETVIGTASVRDVFTAGKSGKAAGCFVEEGVMKRGAKARLLRDDTVVYTGRITSVRRFKDDVEEVRSGTECGVLLENFSDIKSGDVIEAFTTEERERVL